MRLIALPKPFWLYSLTSALLAYVITVARPAVLLSLAIDLMLIYFVYRFEWPAVRECSKWTQLIRCLPYASAILFWIPIHTFAVYPDLQYREDIFFIMSFMIFLGMLGQVFSVIAVRFVSS